MAKNHRGQCLNGQRIKWLNVKAEIVYGKLSNRKLINT